MSEETKWVPPKCVPPGYRPSLSYPGIHDADGEDPLPRPPLPKENFQEELRKLVPLWKAAPMDVWRWIRRR